MIKLTKKLIRYLLIQFERISKEGLKTRLKALFKKIIKAVLSFPLFFVKKYPRLTRRIIFVLKKLGLYSIFYSAYLQLDQIRKKEDTSKLPFEGVPLSALAQKVYAELQTKIEAKTKRIH